MLVEPTTKVPGLNEESTCLMLPWVVPHDPKDLYRVMAEGLWEEYVESGEDHRDWLKSRFKLADEILGESNLFTSEAQQFIRYSFGARYAATVRNFYNSQANPDELWHGLLYLTNTGLSKYETTKQVFAAKAKAQTLAQQGLNEGWLADYEYSHANKKAEAFLAQALLGYVRSGGDLVSWQSRYHQAHGKLIELVESRLSTSTIAYDLAWDLLKEQKVQKRHQMVSAMLGLVRKISGLSKYLHGEVKSKKFEEAFT